MDILYITQTTWPARINNTLWTKDLCKMVIEFVQCKLTLPVSRWCLKDFSCWLWCVFKWCLRSLFTLLASQTTRTAINATTKQQRIFDTLIWCSQIVKFPTWQLTVATLAWATPILNTQLHRLHEVEQSIMWGCQDMADKIILTQRDVFTRSVIPMPWCALYCDVHELLAQCFLNYPNLLIFQKPRLPITVNGSFKQN